MDDHEREMVNFEQDWSILQKGITKLLKIRLEGVPEQQVDSEEHMVLYTTIFRMCTSRCKSRENLLSKLYHRYKDIFKEYMYGMVLPAVRGKHDEFMLKELVKGWDNHRIMVQWFSHIFEYLDRFYIPWKQLPTLNAVGNLFRDQVYAEMKNNVRDAVISLIDREREGEQIDRSLLTKGIGIFVEVGMGRMDTYESDFELPMLSDTAAYYSRKAVSWIEEDSSPDYMLKVEECLKSEKERAGQYLHASSEQKILEILEHVRRLLSQHKNQILEKEHSGCHALLKDEKVEQFSRIFRTCRLLGSIPKDPEPVAAVVSQHVTDEVAALVKLAEDGAARDRVAEEKDIDIRGGHGLDQAFARKVIELYDKYLQYVRGGFDNHFLFREALKKSFEAFSNQDGAGSSSAEFLATFCDNLLKKGGRAKWSNEDIEDMLEKVVRLVADISDKDLFVEFYRKKLARRLLSHKCSTADHERSILTKLKQQFGGQFTSKMEGMVTDLTRKNLETSFQTYWDVNSTSNPAVDFNVTVLTTGFWPSYKSSNLALPAEMVKCVEGFKDFYHTETKHRKLTWIHSLGTCNISGKFDAKPVELIVTTYQAALLLLFNATERLSYTDIKEKLDLTDEDIVRLLHSLSCAKHKILNKDPNTKTVSPADSFEFNTKFTHKARRIMIPLPPMDEKKKVIQDVNNDRRYAIDATIIRIMKNHKVLLHQQLVLECVDQLGRMFKPDIKVIKMRMEDLIAREYLERDKDNPNAFRYLA